MKLKAIKNTSQKTSYNWSYYIRDDDRDPCFVVAAIARTLMTPKKDKALADLFAVAPETAAELERVREELVKMEELCIKNCGERDSSYREHNKTTDEFNRVQALNAEMLAVLKRANCRWQEPSIARDIERVLKKAKAEKD